MNQLTPENAAYIAGFVDGEGSICISGSGSKARPGVYIGNTNEGILRWIADVTGIGTITPFQYENPKHKMRFTWAVGMIEGIEFLRVIRPHLKIKVAQADLFMQFPVMNSRRITGDERILRIEIRDKIKQLNHRGRIAA